MPDHDIILRTATAADMPGIFRVRTSVRENLLTLEQLRRRGITNESVVASFQQDAKGWVAERHSEIVAFVIADRAQRSLFALFVLPEYEGRGLGTSLYDMAVRWLAENDIKRVWLTTDPDSKAATFYERRGWATVGREATGDVRYELAIP